MTVADEAARREIMELEAGIYGDPGSRHAVGHVLADEFWEVSQDGEKVTREVLLQRLESSPLVVDEYPIDDVRVDVYGDVAISTGRAVLHGRMPVDDGADHKIVRATRYVHVWVRREGEWQTVFAQNSNSVEP